MATVKRITISIVLVLGLAAGIYWRQWLFLPADMELMAYQSGRNSNIPAFAVRSGAALYPGDCLYLRWKSKVPAYLYLVHLHVRNGSLRMLFPCPRIPVENPLPADREVSIPPQGGYWLLDANEGDQLLLILADRRSWPSATGRVQAWAQQISELPIQERMEWLLDKAGDAYSLRKSIRFYNRP